jgi:DNA-binding transcriptional LysR family regulator
MDVRATRLAELPAILPESDTFTRRMIERAFSSQGLSLNVGLTTNYLETIKMLVRVGLGWSVLPQRMLDESLLTLHIPELSLTRRLGAVWHRQRTLTNASRNLLNLLQTNPDGL